MRKVIFVAAVSALAAAPAFAEFGSIVNSWRVPHPFISGYDLCLGVAWDGNYIWCNVIHEYGDDRMYRCRPSNGSVVASFVTGFNSQISGGWICYRPWNGQNCLDVVVNYPEAGREIWRFNFAGSRLWHNPVTLPGGHRPVGVYWDGAYHWVTSPNGELTGETWVFKLNAACSAISSFKINRAGNAYGITKQGDFFWFSVENFNPPDVYGGFKTLNNGSVVASFDSLTQRVYDCTYENNHLWVSRYNYVYCVDVANAPAVAPASVGRVKALFR